MHRTAVGPITGQGLPVVTGLNWSTNGRRSTPTSRTLRIFLQRACFRTLNYVRQPEKGANVRSLLNTEDTEFRHEARAWQRETVPGERVLGLPR